MGDGKGKGYIISILRRFRGIQSAACLMSSTIGSQNAVMLMIRKLLANQSFLCLQKEWSELMFPKESYTACKHSMLSVLLTASLILANL